MACVARSRPCLAEPPAESPSTMKSSDSVGSVDAQSESLPGRLRRCETALLRRTALAAARLAWRALAAWMMRATMASAVDGVALRNCSNSTRKAPETAARASGLLSFSLVCPWNWGSTW